MYKPTGFLKLMNNIHIIFVLGLLGYGIYLFYNMHNQQDNSKGKLTVDHPKDTSTYDLYGPPVLDTYKKVEGDLPRLAF